MANQATIYAIKTALQNEEKSIKLYSDAAKNTKNPVVKKTMEFLANWEKMHADKIRRLNAHILGEMAIFSIQKECNEDPMCVVKDFFSKNIDDFEEKLKGEASDIIVYETGMKIEQEGYKFYKKAAKDSDDQEAKQLFDFLAKEEDIHYTFLEDQHAYLSNPSSWYMDDEKWTLEG